MLQWITGYLISLVRYPSGVHNTGFFQKNVPPNAPDWIETHRWGIEVKKDYVVASVLQTLEWLAGIGTIEFHILPLQPPDYKKPSYLVFDFDPPESMGFTELLSFSQLFHHHLQSEGIQSFLKTSGKKGVHLLCPANHLHVTSGFNYVRDLTQSFLTSHPGLVTTELRKIKRGNRLFIDIYRNHPGQTIVAPLSVRATPEATVSMPLDWTILRNIKSPADFTLLSVTKMLDKKNWRPWRNFPNQKTRPV